MIKSTAIILTAGLAFTALSAQAKPSLRDVPEIENGLFAVAIADEIRDNCGTISARMVKALGVLRGLKAHANGLGYSDSEIRNYIESDTEKARMRRKGEAYLRQNGVSYTKPETFCSFGRKEIAKGSAIGVLLKTR
jgi:hypothetical protein